MVIRNKLPPSALRRGIGREDETQLVVEGEEIGLNAFKDNDRDGCCKE